MKMLDSVKLKPMVYHAILQDAKNFRINIFFEVVYLLMNTSRHF